MDHSAKATSKAAACFGRRRSCTPPRLPSTLPWRGLVTLYTAFVIDLATRRVHVLGTTAHPDELFMRQVVRTLTMADGETCRVLICDRDAKWSAAVRERLEEAGMRVVQTPYQAPNANAFAERFVRSIKEECLDRIIPIREGTLPTSGVRVCRALPSREEPPRSGQGVDRGRSAHW